MSYDLNFWKEKPGVSLGPQEIYERLSDGETLDGLEQLPIKDILARIAEIFSEGWGRLDDVTWEAPNKAFQLFTTPQFFRADCYGLDEDEMNKLIDIGGEFGCPLYDPQVGQRFTIG